MGERIVETLAFAELGGWEELRQLIQAEGLGAKRSGRGRCKQRLAMT
jgi:hypothetical protein